VNLLLIGVAFCGALAVFGGIALVHLGRRRPGSVLAFTTAPSPVAGAADGRSPTGARSSERRGASARSRSWIPMRRLSAGTAVFAASFALYAVVGGILVLHYGSIVGDAESRVADGWYVYFSRDPHLAAVGFVWAPLPSLFVSPLFLFKSAWPALTHRAFAGNIISAAFMAGCVVQLRATLRDLRTNRLVMWVLVAGFALNPMIIYYGANGMSEGIQLFFLIVGVRYLLAWVQTPAIKPLVYSSISFAIGYLTRYESIAAAGAGLAVVAVVASARAGGVRKPQLREASMDVIVYAVPPAAAFLGWAIISYVITGHAFEYTASVYGNSSQLTVVGNGISHQKLGYPLPVFGGLQLLSFAPLLPILLAGACWVCWKRRDLRVLALGPFLGVLGFTYLLFVSGSAFPWLRFYLPGLPLSALCIAFLLIPAKTPAPSSVSRPRLRAVGLALTAAVLIVPALPTSALAMNDPKLGSGERLNLAWVLWGRPDNSSQFVQQHVVSSVNSITASLDARHLPPGSIITDTFTPCVSLILMVSTNPHQFVITSDRDFQPVLADPPTFRAEYLLVPPNTGYGSLDAVNRTYPDLYASGARFAHQVWETHEPGCPAFRLYRAITSPRSGGGAAAAGTRGAG
jgi:hypothetical protein